SQSLAQDLAHKIMARALIGLGNAEQALADFDALLKTSQYDVDGYAGRAQAYRMLARFKEAVRDLNQAIEIDPRAELIRERADLWESAGELNFAISDVPTLLDSDPKNIALLLRRAGLFDRAKQQEPADQDRIAVAKLNPTHPAINAGCIGSS